MQQHLGSIQDILKRMNIVTYNEDVDVLEEGKGFEIVENVVPKEAFDSALDLVESVLKKNDPVVTRNLRYGITFDYLIEGIELDDGIYWIPDKIGDILLNTDSKQSLFVRDFCEIINNLVGDNICGPFVDFSEE